MSGYDCTIVCNGKEALDAVEENDYDIIVMDCMMPELDGYGATRRIRQNEKTSNRRVPIIALTANAMKGDRALCLESGMDDYLSKPLDPAELVGMIQKWYANANVADKPAIQPESDIHADNDVPLFDRAVVLKRCMGNNALVDKLLIKFFAQLDADILSLDAAFSESDLNRMVHSAHRIKGAAANLSMESLRETAAYIERSGHEGDFRAVADGICKLSTVTARTQEFISSAQATSVPREGTTR
jgi:CheY-like chemotaxis protein